ncbi:MAG: hypothetical protein JKY33_00425 [Bacteroidia bacterium]|nr:hypothetical protein [Bacteroidia bacterium]
MNKYLNIILLSSFLISACSCEKDDILAETEISDQKNEPAGIALKQNKQQLLDIAILRSYLPASVQGYPITEQIDKCNTNPKVNEACNNFQDNIGDKGVYTAIADFKEQPGKYAAFLKGKGLIQDADGNDFGMRITDSPSGNSGRGDDEDKANPGYLVLQSIGKGAINMSEVTPTHLGMRLFYSVGNDGSYITDPPSGNNGNKKDITDSPSGNSGHEDDFFELNTNVSYKGWEIYDAQSRTAMLIIAISDRYGILIEADDQDNTNLVKDIADAIDYESLISE